MLEINGLTKEYPGGKKAVDNLSFEVEAGQIHGFIGHNGAGKTTTLRCVTGIMDFSAGQISIDGHDIIKEPIKAKEITAFLPDNPDIYEYLTGIQYLKFIADMYRISEAERRESIEKYADAFKMTGNLGNPVGSYSHGMKQKLALISAFIRKPRLLILDEPFVGLDPEGSYTMKQYLREVCDNGGAVLFSSHVLEVVQSLCDKVTIIKQGKLITSGATKDIIGDKSLESVFLELEDGTDKDTGSEAAQEGTE